MIANIIISVIIATIASEHICRVNDIAHRPSVFLNFIAELSKTLWTNIGHYAAVLSSFYEYLHIADLANTLYGLFKPVWDFFTSPFWAVVEYCKTIITYDHPYLIVLGSITIILGVAYGAFKMGWIPIASIEVSVSTGTWTAIATFIGVVTVLVFVVGLANLLCSHGIEL